MNLDQLINGSEIYLSESNNTDNTERFSESPASLKFSEHFSFDTRDPYLKHRALMKIAGLIMENYEYNEEESFKLALSIEDIIRQRHSDMSDKYKEKLWIIIYCLKVIFSL